MDTSYTCCNKESSRSITARCRRARGVFELRSEDERAWYRVVYLSRIHDGIYVLHCFEKKSREIPTNDFDVAQTRLKAVQMRIRQEKKHAKRSH